MKGLLRRGALALAVCSALLTLAAIPALAQVETLYTGVTPPGVGGVLASSGQRAAVTPTAAVQGGVLGAQGQVLPLQVSGGGVAPAQQARVQGLAFTGADIATMVLIGLSAVALGIVLARRGRPRTTT
ncbi:MAG: hypothetical protein M3326_00650 [Actinomycetota bacterium]|nr:hypothetical protein [Actinomycetota bacterium]